MRVLHILLSMGVGGVERGVQNVVERLGRRGCVQGVICLEKSGALGGQLPPSVSVFCCNAGSSTSKVQLLADVARKLRHFKPDIVHVRNCTAWLYAGIAWEVARSPGRLVFSVHGLDWDGPLPLLRKMAFRHLAQRTSALLAVSATTADEFSSASGIPRDRFRVVHSGIDLQQFRPMTSREWGSPCQICRVVSVARLGDRKGHDLLLTALARLRRDGGGTIELLVVGDGPRRDALTELAQELGISDAVRFVGEVDDVASLLRMADVFVLPSLSEGRPTSIMEAMATGLPVVASRVGAVDSLVIHGVTGFLVEPGDLDSLAHAIGKLSQDPGLRKAFGAAGRRKAVTQFSVESMGAEYDRLYRSLVESTSRGLHR